MIKFNTSPHQKSEKIADWTVCASMLQMIAEYRFRVFNWARADGHADLVPRMKANLVTSAVPPSREHERNMPDVYTRSKF